MVSILNGLSSLGQGVSQFAGTAGLEAQKSQLAQQSVILADQLATTRETTLQKSAGDIAAAAQEKQNTFLGGQGDLQRQSAQTIAQTGAGATLGAAGISAGASKYAADVQSRNVQAQINAPTEMMKNAAAATDSTPQADAIRTEMLPKDAQLAEYMKGAPQDVQDAMNGILMGRPRYTFQPATGPDPSDPSKIISGVNKQDSRLGTIDFVPTGTDPNKPGAAGGMGNRAEVYFKRVTTAGHEAAAAAANIMELPAGSDSGWFAHGGQPMGLMAAAKSSLQNELTTQQVQDYNTMVPGVSRSLAAIETSGLAPSGQMSSSMDSLTLKAGDSEMTKMRKMAEFRQIVETGMQVNLVDPKVPPAQKAEVQDIITQIQKAIPFTQHDLTTLQMSSDPNRTMADVVRARGLGPNAAQPPAGGAKAPPVAPANPNIIRYDADGNRVAQ